MEIAPELKTQLPWEGELSRLWALGWPGADGGLHAADAWWEDPPEAQVEEEQKEWWRFPAKPRDQGFLATARRDILTLQVGGMSHAWEVESRHFWGTAVSEADAVTQPGGLGGYVYVRSPDGCLEWWFITGQEAPAERGRRGSKVIWQEKGNLGNLTLTCLDVGGREYCLELEEPGRSRHWYLQAEPYGDYYPAAELESTNGATLGAYLYEVAPGETPRWAYVHGVNRPAALGKPAAPAATPWASTLEALLRGMLALALRA